MAEADTTQQKKAPLPMREPAEVDETRSNPVGLIFIAALFGALWYFTNLTTFWIAVGLLVSIFLHELGHFMTARWTGMKATQFFLFMGPRIWSFRRGETEYGVRTYPLGAFVRIVGMNNLDPPPEEDKDRSYMSKSYPKRMLVITAGSLMHFTIAIVLLTGLLSVFGARVPDTESGWSIDAVGGPAEEAGLQSGDRIVAVDEVETETFEELRSYLIERPGETVNLEYVRMGETAVTTATLGTSASGDGQLCLSSQHNDHIRERQGPFAGFQTFGRFVSLTASGLDEVPRALWNSLSRIGTAEKVSVDPIATDCQPTSDEGSRPISVIGFVSIAGESDGIDEAILMLAGFNIILGLFNLLPFLPLDGGHAAIATYERIRSRKGRRYYADFNKMVPLTYVVMFLLLTLGVSTMILDIVRPLTTN